MVRQELPNLLTWVRFLHDMPFTRDAGLRTIDYESMWPSSILGTGTIYGSGERWTLR